MQFFKTKFKNAWLTKPKINKDERGFFLESFSSKTFIEHGITENFIQDNHSLSVETGVIRGMHFQLPDSAQGKLVRVIKGSVLDVIVDLRKNEKTYGQWQSFKLSSTNFLMLFVPRGFAHGFCTLEKNTEFVYKVDNFYSKQHESGIMWNDPDLKIKWPANTPIISSKDNTLLRFCDFISPF